MIGLEEIRNSDNINTGASMTEKSRLDNRFEHNIVLKTLGNKIKDKEPAKHRDETIRPDLPPVNILKKSMINWHKSKIFDFFGKIY